MVKKIIILFFLFIPLINAELIPVLDSSQQKMFYQTIHRLSSEQNRILIPSLYQLLLDQPQNEKLISLLLALTIKEGNIDSVFSEASLRSLSLSSSFELWIKAAAASYCKDSTKAADFYIQALSQDTIGFYMLLDCCEFLNQFHLKDEYKKALHSVKTDSSLIKALFFHGSEAWRQSSVWMQKSIKKYPEYGLLYYLEAENYYRRGQFDTADSLLVIADSIAWTQYDYSLKSRIMTMRGMLARARGHLDLAIQCYTVSDSIARKICDYHQLHVNAANCGNIYFIKGEFAEAIQYYNKAIHIATSIHAYHQLAYWYKNYGQALVQINEYYEALQVFHKAEHFARQSGLTELSVIIMMAEADVYAHLNQNPLAFKIYEKALKNARLRNYTDLIQQLMTRYAAQLLEQKRFSEAQEIYHEHLAYLKDQNRMIEQAYWTTQLAFTFERQGDLDQARMYYMKALKITEENHISEYQMWILYLLAENDEKNRSYSDAKEKYQKILQNRDTIQDELIVNAFTGIARICFQQGKKIESIEAFKEAMLLIEAHRKNLDIDQLRQGYFSKYVSIYHHLTALYAICFSETRKSAYMDSLMFFYQMGRARSVRDVLNRQSEERDLNALKASKRGDYHASCKTLELSQHQLREALQSSLPEDTLEMMKGRVEAAKLSLLNQRIKLISRTSPDMDHDILPATMKIPVHLSLPDNFGVILYHLDSFYPFILVLTSQDTLCVSLQNNPTLIKSKIDTLVSSFHQVQPDHVPFHAKIAFELYQILIQPIEDTVCLPPQLWVVPDLKMIHLPLEILLTKSPGQPIFDLNDKPVYAKDFLLHRYAIYYDHMACFNETHLKSACRSEKIIVFANPLFFSERTESTEGFRSSHDWSFMPLPFSEIEASKIEKSFQDVEVFTRDHATEKKITDTPLYGKILHIASHAVIDSVFPEFSGLVLTTTRDSMDDGILMGYEISDLKLACDLVTLSGCATGCGRLMQGEGVLGLPRAFLQAGACSVMMTLWKVDDQFTSEFIPIYYGYYLEKHQTKAASLAFSKRQFISQISHNEQGHYYQHPFYWSSFMLYGEQYRDVEKDLPWKYCFFGGVFMVLLVGYLLYRMRKQNMIRS